MAATAVHTNHLNGISLNSLAKNEINQSSDQNSNNPAEDGDEENSDENQKEVDIGTVHQIVSPISNLESTNM